MEENPTLSILCVGEDTELLKTRAAILCATGAEVQWSATRDAIGVLEQRHFDLVVLCHTTRPSESQQICKAAHLQSAHSRVLRLTPLWDGGTSNTASGVHSGAKDGFDAVATTEPAALIRSASALLREREFHRINSLRVR